FGVGPGGARLSAGMMAHVWTVAAGKDVAAKIYLEDGRGRDSSIQPDFSGKLISISKDGATLTFKSVRRSADANTTEIKLTIDTVLTYSNIVKGGTKPTVGYTADVWLKRGSKTNAAAISFRGNAGLTRERSEGLRVITNRRVAISEDGKRITLDIPPLERGGEGSKLEVKIDDKTHVTYHNVGPGEDRPGEGYGATVTLPDGAKDVAVAVAFL